LIEKWHGKGRLLYAVTPRFAPTSTPAQLQAAGKLLSEHPSVYMHTHLSENPSEVAWVKELFPERAGYLDVYDHYGLTGSRSIFAHSIHLTDDEMSRMAATDSVASFCPTSNLFLGSGLFKLYPMLERGVRVGLGTDVGAGTSFSMLETLGEAYKIAQLQRQKLSATLGFYLATLGGAKALSVDDRIGNFAKGKEADFVVLDLASTPLLGMRMANSKTLQDKLFVLMSLGDDRSVAATYVSGRLAFEAGK
jgi:guanine deaminase